MKKCVNLKGYNLLSVQIILKSARIDTSVNETAQLQHGVVVMYLTVAGTNFSEF